MKDGRSSNLVEFNNDPIAALIDANNTKLTGICFALVMEHEGELSIHYRSHQPCYGECRKYFKSHKDYTDPYPHDEYRPGDLYDPFPVGKPVAVSFGWNGRSNYNREKLQPYLDRLFGPKSPWISGFGSPDDIEFSELNGVVTGVVFKETHIDPTVMINLIQNCKNLKVDQRIEEFSSDDDIGMFFLSFAGFMLGVEYGSNKLQIMNPFMQSYYNPMCLDLPRFIHQNPHQLSGGTGYFDEGSDYNRKILHETFERSRTTFVNGKWKNQHRENIPNLISIYTEANSGSRAYNPELLRKVVEEEFTKQLEEDESHWCY